MDDFIYPLSLMVGGFLLGITMCPNQDQEQEHTGKFLIMMDKSTFETGSYQRINRWEYRFEVDGVPITVDKDKVIIKEIK